MALTRSGLDRRSNINRRFLELDVSTERRRTERRQRGERRRIWIRTSEWSSMDLGIRNRYYWTMMNPGEYLSR